MVETRTPQRMQCKSTYIFLLMYFWLLLRKLLHSKKAAKEIFTIREKHIAYEPFNMIEQMQLRHTV